MLKASAGEARTQSVGDTTTGRKPAYLGRVNVISSLRVLKPKKEDRGPGL